MSRKLPRLKKHVWITLLVILALAVASEVIYVSVYSRNAYTISHTTVESSSFPRAFNNFSIAMISDVHLSKKSDLDRLQKIVKKLNAQKPDMVLFGGDLYASRVFSATNVMKVLKAVKAPYGKFAVLGDEDTKNRQQTTTILNDGGFEVLNNEERPIYYKEKKISLYGMTTSGTSTKIDHDNYTIILTHYPDDFKTYASSCDLQLSGHSGGGYIVLPIIGALIKTSHASQYVHGTYHKGKATLLISNGVSPTASTPYKFGAKNEVMIISLHYGNS